QNEGRGGFQWGLSESSWDDSVTTRVDSQGWAEFPALAFGKGTVVVRAKGFARTKLEWVKNEDEFRVFLEPEAKLSGTVHDESGKPVSGSLIRLSWGMAEAMNVPIDEKDGRFTADGLAAGKYFLNVLGKGGPARHSEQIDLQPGETVVKDITVK